MPHPAWIEIDLGQLRRNLARIGRLVAPARLAFVVKANAYGHGLVPVAKGVEEHVDLFAVACADEAIALQEAGVRKPLLVLGAVDQEQIDTLIERDIEFTISSPFKGRLVTEACRRKGKPARIHIEVDTGMQRTGMRPDTTIRFCQELDRRWLIPCGIYSHFANADQQDVQDQLAAFQQLLTHPAVASIPLRHLANSAGALYAPASRLDMVRVGLLAYGYPAGTLEGILPCFSLKSRISYFKVVEAGQGISYGHTFVTDRRMRIVTIPVGYGDGYRRALSNKGSVLIRGKRYPIVGAICMDQFLVALGDEEAYVGEEAVLIGRQGDGEISIEEIADLCGTIPYEILCQFTERIPRRYVDAVPTAPMV